MVDGDVEVLGYASTDACALFAALDDARVWEHIPRDVPASDSELDESIKRKLVDGLRLTFVVRRSDRVVGTTSVLFDPDDPAGAEIGGSQLIPDEWGTGLNGRVKRLLLAVLFDEGAEWVQFRTDERNARSAAAIRKLGATDLGVHQDHRVRRDGTVRRSRMFRLSPGDHDVATSTL